MAGRMRELLRRLNDPDWEDLSDYVVHFTRKTIENDCAANIESILLQGSIDARTKFGVGRYYPGCEKAVCLSEVPILHLPPVTIRRGVFGIGFTKSFIFQLGGGPLFYLTGGRYEAIAALMKTAANDLDAPVWKLVPYIDQGSGAYDFDWEREWRVPGAIPVTPENVSFLFLPHSLHEDFRGYLRRKHSEGSMPLFDCPLIDPKWPKERIRECLR